MRNTAASASRWLWMIIVIELSWLESFLAILKYRWIYLCFLHPFPQYWVLTQAFVRSYIPTLGTSSFMQHSCRVRPLRPPKQPASWELGVSFHSFLDLLPNFRGVPSLNVCPPCTDQATRESLRKHVSRRCLMRWRDSQGIEYSLRGIVTKWRLDIENQLCGGGVQSRNWSTAH